MSLYNFAVATIKAPETKEGLDTVRFPTRGREDRAVSGISGPQCSRSLQVRRNPHLPVSTMPVDGLSE